MRRVIETERRALGTSELSVKRGSSMKRITITMDDEIVRLAKKRAAEEQRTVSNVIQESLVKHLERDTATRKERNIAYQLFCERPMKVPRKQLRFILNEDMWRL